MSPSRHRLLILLLLLFAFYSTVTAQDPVQEVRGMVSGKDFVPLEGTQIINLDRGVINFADSAGIFRIRARKNDTLLFRNLNYHDTVIAVKNPMMFYRLEMSRKMYAIKEVKIYTWGSTYEDMKKALLEMPSQPDLQEKLGLPVADPDALPFYLDEEALKNPWFAISSPVSFLYYNYNKFEKSRRKVHYLEQTEDKRKVFEETFSRENVTSLTGLKGEALDSFWIYLNENLICDMNCPEMQVLEEILVHFERWKSISGTD